ncbi:MAG: hypothetical protein AB7F93_01930, partial [Immundisolibacter sp.]
MIWDVGHQDENRPSSILPRSGIRSVEYLFITNYDEDHVSDMPEFRKEVGIRAVYRNKSIDAAALRALKLKSGPISPAMESTLELISRYNAPLAAPLPEFPGVTYSVYCNQFGAEYEDTNNISLVTFLTIGSTKFIIPGDLERKGWLGVTSRPISWFSVKELRMRDIPALQCLCRGLGVQGLLGQVVVV